MTFDSAPPSDVLFVPGGSPGVDDNLGNERLLAFLRAQAAEAKYVTAVCTGALLLGAAGLLDGYRAATHWMAMDFLAPFGATPVHERIVIDRTRITGGGVTAGIDVALSIAAELHGSDVAKEIQLFVEYDPQPPFHSGSPRIADPALVERVRAKNANLVEKRGGLVNAAAARLKLSQ
jgi:cyclohexyl-isocyanide hydratase